MNSIHFDMSTGAGCAKYIDLAINPIHDTSDAKHELAWKQHQVGLWLS